MFSATLLLGTLNREKKISVYDGSVINVDSIFYKLSNHTGKKQPPEVFYKESYS